jgi:hypothetical protein
MDAALVPKVSLNCARNYWSTPRGLRLHYVCASDRLNALQLRRQNPFPRWPETIVLGRTEKESRRLALTNVRWTTRAPERGPWRGRGRHGPCVGAGAQPQSCEQRDRSRSVIALPFAGDQGGLALVRSSEGGRLGPAGNGSN